MDRHASSAFSLAEALVSEAGISGSGPTLASSAEALYQLVDGNPFGLYIVDADFRLVSDRGMLRW